MEPNLNRRLTVLILLSLILLLTSWVDIHSVGTSAPSFTYPFKAVFRSVRSLGQSKLKKKRSVDHPSKTDSPSYSNFVQSQTKLFIKTSTFYFDVYSCLPRFICEVYAEPPGALLTELERDVLSFFSKSYSTLEGPSSSVYIYQIAAHMGQLATGLHPSPCYNMYPSCPLSRLQLAEVFSGIKMRKTYL